MQIFYFLKSKSPAWTQPQILDRIEQKHIIDAKDDTLSQIFSESNSQTLN